MDGGKTQIMARDKLRVWIPSANHNKKVFDELRHAASYSGVGDQLPSE
jgi:hypothetical protein